MCSIEKNLLTSTPQPEENGTPTAAKPEAKEEKTFTQEEVNRIIADRLARERAKASEPSSEETKRTAELNARESRLNCKEFLMQSGYPMELLELLDTSDFENFKEKTEKLDEAMNNPRNARRCQATPSFHANEVVTDTIAEAFSINSKHIPKGQWNKEY